MFYLDTLSYFLFVCKDIFLAKSYKLYIDTLIRSITEYKQLTLPGSLI